MKVSVHQFDDVSKRRVLPLAAGLIVASARADPGVARFADFDILTERLDPDRVVAGYAGAPDVLAFSLYTWNARYSFEVARRARERYPGALTVCGGPSVPRHPSQVRRFFEAHPAVEVVVFGEGERSFREILSALDAGLDLRAVPGIAVRDDRAEGGVAIAAERPRIRDFQDTGSPYLDGTFDALMERRSPAPTSAAVETNRGCPFSCTFCDWGQAIASRVHELPIERVEAELGWIASRGIPQVYIVDANFGMRRRDVDILRTLARLKEATGFPFFCFFHLTKNASERHLVLVETLREAGIGCQLAVSIQDFAPAVLRAVQRENIRVDTSLRLLEACSEGGIPTFTELILGLPGQTLQSFRESVVKAVSPYPGNSFWLYLCRLLVNAEMASDEQRARWGLETRSCRIGSSHRVPAEAWVDEEEEVVVGTVDLPVADWRRAFVFGYLVRALHGFRLLDVGIQLVQQTVEADLLDYFVRLQHGIDAAPEGTALARWRAVFERFVESILAGGGGLVQEMEETGRFAWEISDALTIAAYADADRFYAELRAVTGQWLGDRVPPIVVDELFAYQRFITPTFDRQEPQELRLTHDWLGYHARAGQPPPIALEATPTRLRYLPPAEVLASRDPTEFIRRQLALLYAKRPGLPIARARGEA